MNIKQSLLFTLILVILIYLALQLRKEEQLVKVFVINLDRSYMRKYSITIQMYLHRLEFNIFSAVNGSNHIFTDDERQLLSGIINEKSEIIARNKNQTPIEIEKTRNNVMACALSHITIWKQNTGTGPILILEDDVTFYSNLKNNIHMALKMLEEYDTDWHILWISGGDPGNRERIGRFSNRIIYKVDPPEYIGQGTAGYILSKKGIEHFTRQLEEKGCFCGIDVFLLKTLDIRHSYGIYKPLISSGLFSSTI